MSHFTDKRRSLVYNSLCLSVSLSLSLSLSLSGILKSGHQDDTYKHYCILNMRSTVTYSPIHNLPTFYSPNRERCLQRYKPNQDFQLILECWLIDNRIQIKTIHLDYYNLFKFKTVFLRFNSTIY
jgi:hypothetical protein